MNNIFLKDNPDITYPFPFSLNKENLNELLKFYSSQQTLCLLQGESGSFKTELLTHSLNYLNENVLLFRFKCFEGTTLDDIFLSFFEDLKKYSQQKKISFTKIETNSLSKRINTYLNHITLPGVIIIDSLENIFIKKNTAEKDEIISFIKHLKSMNKFKIILISSVFDTSARDDLESYVSIQIPEFNKEQVKQYFEHYSINIDSDILDNFFNIIKGNTLYTELTVNLIITLKTNISSLISEFLSKKITYDYFIFQKLITFIPDSVKKHLYTLALFNEGITEEFLLKENFLTKDQILYLTEKNILCFEYGLLFLKPYLKKYLQRTIAQFDKIKIHKYWYNFYNSQLPVKPNNRIILISRNTMRTQIEFHNSFVTEERPKEQKQADMSLMSYLNSNLTAWNIKNTNRDENDDDKDNTNESKEHKKRPIPPKSLINRDKRFENYALTKDEISLLSMPVDMQKKENELAKEKLYRTIEQREESIQKEQKENSVTELYKKACELESLHDYETEYTLLCRMLSLKTDSDFYEYEPLILDKLAFCSKKMNKTTDAIDFYNKLTELYGFRNNQEKTNEVRLKIASVYKEIYKINHAKAIFENFINKKTPASDDIILRSYIELAEIEEDLTNTEKAVEYYKKAFSLSDTLSSTKLEENYLAQAYFKYALILDDYNQIPQALEFYEKCIQNASDSCIYKSSAYTNIAEIVKETDNLSKASDCYKHALKIDIKNSNYEGVYYICLKLAKLYETIDNEKVLDWLLKSLSAAKRTKDNLYITNAYIETGDYYTEIKNYQKGFKAYLLADKYLKKQDTATHDEKALYVKTDNVKKKLSKEQISQIETEVNQND